MVRKIVKIFFFNLVIFFFFSCVIDHAILRKDYTITNISTAEISFLLPDYGNEVYRLAPNEKMIKYMYAQPRLQFTRDFRTTYYEISESETVIKDRSSWDLRIENRSGSAVVVFEKNNNMGYFDHTGSISPIKLTQDETKNEKLFSQIPEFSVCFFPEKEYPPSFEVVKTDSNFLLVIKP